MSPVEKITQTTTKEVNDLLKKLEKTPDNFDNINQIEYMFADIEENDLNKLTENLDNLFIKETSRVGFDFKKVKESLNIA